MPRYVLDGSSAKYSVTGDPEPNRFGWQRAGAVHQVTGASKILSSARGRFPYYLVGELTVEAAFGQGSVSASGLLAAAGIKGAIVSGEVVGIGTDSIAIIGGGFGDFIGHGLLSATGTSVRTQDGDVVGAGYTVADGDATELNFAVARTGSITAQTGGVTSPATFSSHALGANSAEASRTNYVFIYYEDADDGSNPSISGVTIDGQTASAVSDASALNTLSPDGRASIQLWSANTSGMGSTGDVVITFSENVENVAIDMWEVVDGAVLDAGGASDASTSDPSSASVTLNTSSGAIAICFAWYNSDTTDGAPIGFTQLQETLIVNNIGTNDVYALAGSNTSPDTPTDTYGIDNPTGSRGQIVACVLEAG